MRSPLHRAFDAAAGTADGFCPTCLCPNPRARMVVLLKPDQDLPRCPDCGRRTDTEGRSLVRSLTEPAPPIKIIVLEHPERVPGLRSP